MSLQQRRGCTCRPDLARSVAERLRDEDDAGSAGTFLVQDEGLAECAARMAQALHPLVFAGQAVFADAAEALVDIAHDLLVADHEDELPGGVGVRTKLATGP